MGVGVRSISVRTSMVVGGLAALMLALCGGWLDRVGNSLADQGEKERALATASSLEASLRSIMLTGHANIVRDWINRISSLPDVESVRIYRTDGSEAFVDPGTLRHVNQWLGEERFPVREEHRSPSVVPEKLAEAFKSVAASATPYLRRDDSEHMTLLYPIHAESSCMQCHGYDQHSNRGVLALSLSTVQAASLVESLKGQALMIFFAMGILLVLGVWLYTRQTILNPIMDFAETARRIVAGSRLQRFNCSSQDELGELAACSNSLLDQLEAELVVEQRLRAREQALLEATVSLSCQRVSREVLKRVGELAMEMTGARYVMLSHLDMNDQKQFISLGMDPEVEQKIARMPEGKGLLGLLWHEGKPVRIDHIQAHPASVGFPEGHPFMRNFLGLPIRFGEQVIGALYLTDRVDGEPFSAEDQTVLEALAAACGVALANAQSMEKLRRLNDVLESQVCERTEELQTSNARLRAREVELEIINEELMQASEAKNQFLANTSHELRTPLNAIIGFSELMGNPRLGALNEKQKRYVDNIHGSGKRLLKIINDLLDISRIEAGMMVVEEHLFSPAEVAEQVLAEMTPLARVKQLTLSLEQQEDMQELVRTDRGKLHQMMVNLVGNAIKFTPEGGSVELSMRILAPEGSVKELLVDVKDTGIGISAEDMEKIFEPFVQARGGLARAYEGTGLGLALTRRQARLLGGDVSATSEVGEGSIFTIHLPCEMVMSGSAQEMAEQQLYEQVHAPIAEPAEVVPSHGPRPRIVVIDEWQERRNAVATALEREGGYEPVQCADVAACLEASSAGFPFLIMLGMSAEGEQTHRNLQAIKSCRRTQSTPVILVGGTADVPEYSMGEVGVIEKGMTQHEMIDVITRYGRLIPSRSEMATVLVIDDDASVRELLKETLLHEGYRILLAASGEEGLRKAIEREPDLIILDLMMPGMTGFDVMSSLRKNPAVADIPVLIFTAKDLSREEILQLGHQADRVLLKGDSNQAEIMRQLHRLELLYPVQAQLIDVSLGCFNQRYMRRRMAQETSTALRHHLSFSILGWEMDGYDAYTEKYGERWGIAALKDMTDTVKTLIRHGDVFARISEKRFEVFLPGITPAGAARVAEKLRIRIQHQRFPLPQGAMAGFTASFGAVHFSYDGEDAEKLLRLLEERIDEACESGGNHCVLGDV
ncbi:response regulator [Mariprofundus erugo]|uniref:ATP-binding protein n=1 Tax=Mariprofundus erugo TaxID=2528639 RepID=UPI0010FE0283|nr:ATP-binding protein [Mariprofundus erugo]TLS76233.1 response regulator [Mariprofundus erugo]